MGSKVSKPKKVKNKKPRQEDTKPSSVEQPNKSPPPSHEAQGSLQPDKSSSPSQEAQGSFQQQGLATEDKQDLKLKVETHDTGIQAGDIDLSSVPKQDIMESGKL